MAQTINAEVSQTSSALTRQVSADYQVISSMFASVIRKLGECPDIGTSHILTTKWVELSKTFRALHRRSQKNSIRLAASIRAQQDDFGSMVAGDLTREEKQGILEAFKKEVSFGQDQAETLTDDYDTLARRVDAFPQVFKLSFPDPQSGGIFTMISQSCKTVSKKISSFFVSIGNFVVNAYKRAMASFKELGRRIASLITNHMAGPYYHQLSSTTSIELSVTVSTCQDIPRWSHRRPEEASPLLNNVKRETQDTCSIIPLKLQGFVNLWHSLILICEELDANLSQAQGRLTTPRMQQQLVRELEQAYRPLEMALRAFASQTANTNTSS